MTRGQLGIVSLALVVSTMVLALWIGSVLPADVRLPVHFGLDGRPDLFAAKWTALAVTPLMLAVNSLFFWALPLLEPRRRGLERSQGLYIACWVAVLFHHLACGVANIAPALGVGVASDRLIIASIGVLLALVGDQLAKSRSMYILGIVTPWTLASEEVWIRTHRFGGKLLTAAGLILFGAALVAVPPATLAMLTAGALLLLLAPMGYSFLAWRREARR